jgi:hypothetical protein
MFIETSLLVRQPRPRAWAKASVGARTKAAPVSAAATSRPAAAGPVKGTSRRKRPQSAKAPLPDGWVRRLREQSHNLARAIQMLEQAATMISEPKSNPLAQAECLRGAGLLTLVAASELLVVAGWFEADQAVNGGTLES